MRRKYYYKHYLYDMNSDKEFEVSYTMHRADPSTGLGPGPEDIEARDEEGREVSLESLLRSVRMDEYDLMEELVEAAADHYRL